MSAQDKPVRCETCRFWPARVESYGTYGNGGPGCNGSVSDCRRRAPRDTKPDQDAYLFGSARWPTTRRDDWCGDWEARPTPSPGEREL